MGEPSPPGSADKEIKRIYDFVKYCSKNCLSFDFLSFHYYGPDISVYETRTHQIRKILDSFGYNNVKIYLTEWNCGIEDNFSNTLKGAAYYFSTLITFIEVGIVEAYQYCCDERPSLGLIEWENCSSREPIIKLAGKALIAWKLFTENSIRLKCEYISKYNRKIKSQETSEGGFKYIAVKTEKLYKVLISNYNMNEKQEIEISLVLTNDLPSYNKIKFTYTRYSFDQNGEWSIVSGKSIGNNYTLNDELKFTISPNSIHLITFKPTKNYEETSK
jgi:hypothetical protein